MKIIDISWLITPDITGYKNKKDVIFTPTRFFEKDALRESHIMIASHSGTHVDAPAHVLADGATIDQVSLNNIIGSAVVIDLTHIESSIKLEDLEPYPFARGSIILLKTRNSELFDNVPFEPDFIYLDDSAAAYCVERNVKAVGIDYLSIERNQPNHATHQILLENNISIIEGLRLHHVEPGYYFFVCLPLNIVGLDAAPARAVLIEQD